MTVGERIKQLCKNAGITVKKLEDDLGYGNGSLATSNDKIQATRAIAISEYFNIPINYLMTGEIPYLEENPTENADLDVMLLVKFHSLNETNQSVILSMIDTLLKSQ